LKQSKTQDSQGERGFFDRRVRGVRKREKNASSTTDIVTFLKRSKTQDSQGERGFFDGRVRGVRKREKTQVQRRIS